MPNLNLDKSSTAVIASELTKGNTANNQMAQERDLIGNARRVMDAARAAGIPVIHVAMGFREGYPEVSDRNKLFKMIKDNGILKAGSEQVEIRDEVKPLPGEVVVSRPRVNPFYNSELESILKARNIDTVAIMGIVTNFSVEAAARYAADADYRVIILEDCCASGRREDHDHAIKYVLSMIADIASSQDFVESVR
jgi:nicotinamidase-related amidase